ncbi:methyl-accepting chemotaxis protein [Zoogloea sp.]|uniref:methyl-accepting chemotaxis protein n=1 Tax=Zoogloea sp. TaxID=49181 RepID=UPI0026370CEE|nr:methyl-accepting chemotaxis protein [Zoogloea sp.]MDD3354128.1 methyl-accepting chemotaxis protein [Zoogloea sp.]
MGFLGKLFGRPGQASGNTAEIRVSATELAELRGQIQAIDTSLAVMEFALDGTILTANNNFLQALGYRLDEIQGKHHRLFMPPAEAASTAYQDFWQTLGYGTHHAGQYRRIGKNGREIWIQATYNPICDPQGRPFKVIKYATNITAVKLRSADFESQLAAIDKVQAIIQFELDGTVVHANPNFLASLGYSLEEITGRHHAMFLPPGEANSPEYAGFWDKLSRGEAQNGRFRRLGKDGREVWIQASYIPIPDLSGKPFKVVKYATDVTLQVREAQALHSTVEETLRVVNAAVQGDLGSQIRKDDKEGLLADLAEGINALLTTMATLVGQIKTASDEVLIGAREIAKGNADLSARTEEQAASLEETASSMDQLNSTVQQNAENAAQANALALRSNDNVQRGSEVVRQVITTMHDIQERSRKIGDIIGVIDSISFQTNILALNAAVEAARAGEQGRGFAVVATEVRNLAQRSARAAQEVKELISASLSAVEAGAVQVSEAGQTMDEVVRSFHEVAALVTGISGASREQAQGIEQITVAVTQMDEVTQQNAALVEEAAAAAESLEEQARNLVQAVARFRLEPPTGKPRLFAIPPLKPGARMAP